MILFSNEPSPSLIEVRKERNDESISFKQYVKEILSEYKNQCEVLKILSPTYLKKLNEVTNKLVEVIEQNLDGKVGTGYKSFCELMDLISEDFVVLQKKSTDDKEINDNISNIDINKENLNVDNIKESLKKLISLSTQTYIENDYYRVRNINEVCVEKEQMFHPPFSISHKIGSLRFSVPGYPCLYLGSSFLVCYNEIGKPSLDNIWVSKYKIIKPIKYIDLSLDLNNIILSISELKKQQQEVNNIINNGFIDIFNDLNLNRKKRRENKMVFKYDNYKNYGEIKNRLVLNKDEDLKRRIEGIYYIVNKNNEFIVEDNFDIIAELEEEENKLIELDNLMKDITSNLYKEFSSALLVYPIQLMSLIKKSYSDIYFPEYIIPQYLMQWIRENKEGYDGVKYLSTKFKKECEYDDTKQNKIADFINLAIPAKSSENNYCKELQEYFEYEKPTRLVNDIRIENLVFLASEAYKNYDFSNFKN